MIGEREQAGGHPPPGQGNGDGAMIDVRDRASEHLNRARLELEVRRSFRPLVVILIGAAIGLAISAYIATKVDPTFFSSTYTVRVAVADASGVVPGSQEIRFKGIPAGVITGVQLVGSRAVVTAQYKKQFGPIYRDAQLELRPNTPLLDMYLDIVSRGTPAAGTLGANQTLPAGQTRVAVNVADVLDVFRSDVRGRLATLLDNLGNGLRDRGAQLREAVIELTPLLVAAGRISQQLAARQVITRQLVHNTAVLMSTLAQRDGDLRNLVLQASSALSALQTGSPNLSATLQDLPPALTQLNSSFAAVRGVLGDVNGAVTALYPVANDVPSALTALRALNSSAAPAVQALQRPIQQLVPFSQALLPLSTDLRQTVAALLPQIPVVDRATQDLASCKTGIQGFFQYTASLGKFGDLRGPVPRGNLVGGLQSLSLPSPWESAPQGCTPGQVIGGRLPAKADEH